LFRCCGPSDPRAIFAYPGARKHRRQRDRQLLMQILGKLYFFDLRENLPIILFDYGQKRLGTANPSFKAACYGTC